MLRRREREGRVGCLEAIVLRISNCVKGSCLGVRMAATHWRLRKWRGRWSVRDSGQVGKRGREQG